MHKKRSLTLFILAFILIFFAISTTLRNNMNSKYDIYTTVDINSFSTNVDYYQHPMCVSLIRNGEQLILDSNIDFITYYSDVYPENINESDIKIIYTKDYYDQSSSGYEFLDNQYIIKYTYKKSPLKSTVKFIDYTDTNNSPNKVWNDYIYDNYNDSFETTDTIKIEIKNAYLYEDDNYRISIINASVFKNAEDYTKTIGKNNISENDVYYNVSMILVNDSPPIYMDSSMENCSDYDKYYNKYLIADVDTDSIVEIIRRKKYPKDSVIEIYSVSDLELCRFRMPV